jgi:hypothetical protein
MLAHSRRRPTPPSPAGPCAAAPGVDVSLSDPRRVGLTRAGAPWFRRPPSSVGVGSVQDARCAPRRTGTHRAPHPESRRGLSAASPHGVFFVARNGRWPPRYVQRAGCGFDNALHHRCVDRPSRPSSRHRWHVCPDRLSVRVEAAQGPKLARGSAVGGCERMTPHDADPCSGRVVGYLAYDFEAGESARSAPRAGQRTTRSPT